jgi:hypothetical protein
VEDVEDVETMRESLLKQVEELNKLASKTQLALERAQVALSELDAKESDSIEGQIAALQAKLAAKGKVENTAKALQAGVSE